jgi:hypothetical protein
MSNERVDTRKLQLFPESASRVPNCWARNTLQLKRGILIDKCRACHIVPNAKIVLGLPNINTGFWRSTLIVLLFLS